MSMEARQMLVDSPRTFFQAESQREDLLNPEITQTYLIAMLLALVNKGWNLEFTAIKSDHHDDSALGEHCHFNGYCADLWPLASPAAGNYLNAASPAFQQFLRDVAASPYLYQVGLAGSADSSVNRDCAGATCFEDDGGDHIHIGVQ